MLGCIVCKPVGQWSLFWCFWWDFAVLVYVVLIHLCDYSFGDDKKLLATERVGQSGTTSTGSGICVQFVFETLQAFLKSPEGFL